MPELFDLRNDFHSGKLKESEVPNHPLTLFEKWITQAIGQKIPEANAMALSTVNEQMQPSSRIVLLKYYDQDGFVFFTNYESKKGKELYFNPKASLLFFWPQLEKQIRIEGIIEKTDKSISDKYFYKRPVESQISACISPQSEPISNRLVLEKMYKEFLNNSETIVRPDSWGGYCLYPSVFEFWQGRANRLHDRIGYYKYNEGWTFRRLAP